ncbi:MAG: hypothetical protein ACI9W6_002278 [Motiliproteus sp.]|jgi:hypothetical protein
MDAQVAAMPLAIKQSRWELACSEQDCKDRRETGDQQTPAAARGAA